MSIWFYFNDIVEYYVFTSAAQSANRPCMRLVFTRRLVILDAMGSLWI